MWMVLAAVFLVSLLVLSDVRALRKSAKIENKAQYDTKYMATIGGVTINVPNQVIILSGEHDASVFEWIKETDITAEIRVKIERKSAWVVYDEKERLMFKLRWADEIIG